MACEVFLLRAQGLLEFFASSGKRFMPPTQKYQMPSRLSERVYETDKQRCQNEEVPSAILRLQN